MFGKSIFKNYSGFINLSARVTDPLVVVLAAIMAYLIRFPFNAALLPNDYRSLVLFAVFCVVLIFPSFSLYASWRGQSLLKQARTIFFAWITVVLLMIIILFSLKISADYSRLWLGWWMMLGLAFLLVFRMCIFGFLQYQRMKGKNFRSVLVVGAGDLGERLINQVKESPWMGFNIVGLFDDDESLHGQVVGGYKVTGGLSDVEAFFKGSQNQVDEVWIALPLRAEQRVKELLYALRHHTVNIKLIPDIFGFSLLNHSMTEIAGLPAVNLSDTPMGGSNQIIKAIEDRFLALCIFIFISPILLIIAITIKVTSQGSILFKQKRHGWDGKIINVYKFRTMKVHTEDNCCVTQASENDARITPFGAFLRRTSLDELPQFYNVLQGRMSIVGPRPHAVQHNELYKEQVNQYMLRHMVKPGITGWAQVNGFRGETDTLDKMKNRVELDLYYIENWSLLFDLKIIFLTIFKGFIHKNAY
ncbi:MAG: undecaprenyl-phosphate glucose phosphotransferase [Woeseiaceae bacterium]